MYLEELKIPDINHHINTFLTRQIATYKYEQ